MDKLNNLVRDRFSHELLHDKAKPFDDEFRRTTDLERAILDEYGRCGAEFLLQHIGLDASIDDTCPWNIGGLDAVRAVRQVLDPLRTLLPEFISVLEDRVRWVIPARGKDGWVLAYLVDRALYDGRRYYEVVLGGPPNSAPRLSARAESMGWKLPRSFAIFCQVHDGFGSDQRILASRNLVDMGEMMDPIAVAQNFQPENYAFQDLLEFFPDGAGNCQSFYRQGSDDADPLTVDWDHETWEISDRKPFFDFADEALLRQILDEE